MTVEIVPFRRWHQEWLDEFGLAAGGIGPVLDPTTMDYLERRDSWTAVHNGEPVACGGYVTQWPGRHVCWMFMNYVAGPHMLSITRAVIKKLDAISGRLELTVRCDFRAGHRWAKMLGFLVETQTMKAYGPEGEDHTLYVRYR